MKDLHKELLQKQIDKHLLNCGKNFDAIEAVDSRIARQILIEILLFCCEAQNMGSINAGRSALSHLSPFWTSKHLPGAINEAVDLADPWQWRRLLEALKEARSPLLKGYCELSLSSKNPEIREVGEDFLDTEN